MGFGTRWCLYSPPTCTNDEENDWAGFRYENQVRTDNPSTGTDLELWEPTWLLEPYGDD